MLSLSLSSRRKSLGALATGSIATAIEKPLPPWLFIGGATPADDTGTSSFALDQRRGWLAEVARLDEIIIATRDPVELRRLQGLRARAAQAAAVWQAKSAALGETLNSVKKFNPHGPLEAEMPASTTPRCEDCRHRVTDGRFYGCSAFIYPSFDRDDPLDQQHPSDVEARADQSLCGDDGRSFQRLTEFEIAFREANARTQWLAYLEVCPGTEGSDDGSEEFAASQSVAWAARAEEFTEWRSRPQRQECRAWAAEWETEASWRRGS